MLSSSPSFALFSAEFINAPLGTLVAAATILALVLKPVLKLKDRLFSYKAGHNAILKEAGVPPFFLNCLLISIPLKTLPSTGWPEKIITGLFITLLAFASWHLVPAFIHTQKTPAGYTWLVWKNSGESFYASQGRAMDATLFTPPRWSVSAEDCGSQPAAETRRPAVAHRTALCALLTTGEGKAYVAKSIEKFKRDRFFLYGMIIFIELLLVWLAFGFALTLYYSNKVRRYILLRQKEAIHCAHGEFSPTGIYAIYAELDDNRPR